MIYIIRTIRPSCRRGSNMCNLETVEKVQKTEKRTLEELFQIPD